MRWLMTLALLALVAWPAAAQENEAEKLWRSMDQKVRTAKTLQIRFDGTITAITPADPKKSNVKGTLILGDGDKLWVEGEGTSPGEESKMTVVSDGTDMKSFGYVQAPGQPKREMNATEKLPKGAGAYYRGALLRHGLFVSFLNVDQRSDFAADSFKLSDFKLAGKEMIGEQNTQVIQYTITAKEKGKDKDPSVLSMKVWLEAKTNLPVKMAMTGGRHGITEFTETYIEFTIDGKVDEKLFALPKGPATKNIKSQEKEDKPDGARLRPHTRPTLTIETARRRRRDHRQLSVVAFSPDGTKLAGTVKQPSGDSIVIWAVSK